MQITINIDKKLFLVLVSVLVLIGIVGFVIAYSYPNGAGHPAGEIAPGKIAGTLQVNEDGGGIEVDGDSTFNNQLEIIGASTFNNRLKVDNSGSFVLPVKTSNPNPEVGEMWIQS